MSHRVYNIDRLTVITVAVGSTNPCKIDAVRNAFESAFDTIRNEITIKISSHKVCSGVSDQPVGEEETKRGAINRARAAYIEAIRVDGDADFSVGLEGGVVWEGDNLWCIDWMAIFGSDSAKCTLCSIDPYTHRDGVFKQIWGMGCTGSFPLPSKVSTLVRGGMELGDANDLVFGRMNSKQKEGAVGILTKGMIGRTEYYDHALKLSLIPWIWPDLYISESESKTVKHIGKNNAVIVSPLTQRPICPMDRIQFSGVEMLIENKT